MNVQEACIRGKEKTRGDIDPSSYPAPYPEEHAAVHSHQSELIKPRCVSVTRTWRTPFTGWMESEIRIYYIYSLFT